VNTTVTPPFRQQLFERIIKKDVISDGNWLKALRIKGLRSFWPQRRRNEPLTVKHPNADRTALLRGRGVQGFSADTASESLSVMLLIPSRNEPLASNESSL
jgi:hypothetical protein